MRKFIFLLLEILAGICILSLLLFAGINKYREYVNTKPSYTVTFRDIDGLGIGSPVRLMGMQIGNVTKLELLNSEIYVTFRNNDKNIKLPEGAVATISFTGLAGSKSLEIMPPSDVSAKNRKILSAVEPVRINSVFEVQNSISESVLEYTKGVLEFIGEENIFFAPEKTGVVSEDIEDVKNIDTEKKEKSEKMSQIIKNQNKNLDTVKQSLEELIKDKTFKTNINNIKTTVENLSEAVDMKKATETVSGLTAGIDDLNTNLGKFNKKVKKVKEREAGYVTEMNESVKKASKSLTEFIGSMRDKFRATEQ